MVFVVTDKIICTVLRYVFYNFCVLEKSANPFIKYYCVTESLKLRNRTKNNNHTNAIKIENKILN
jgi:hypothetical protein